MLIRVLIHVELYAPNKRPFSSGVIRVGMFTTELSIGIGLGTGVAPYLTYLLVITCRSYTGRPRANF